MNWGINKILNWLTKGHVSKFFKKEHCKHDLPVAFVAGKIFVLFLLISGLNSFGQATIWEEDFNSYVDDTGIDGTGDIGDYPGSVSKWAIDASGTTLSDDDDFLKVNSECFQGKDLHGKGVWFSESVNISNFTNVQVSSVFWKYLGTMESTDSINFYYRLDGAAWTAISLLNGDISTIPQTYSVSNLSGNNLELKAEITLNIGGWENYAFDDILVQGTPTIAPSCTTPISPTIGEVDFAVNGTLSWNLAAGATGYYLYFGTDASATNTENATDLGNVTSYTPASDMNFLTDYYWKIVPYNGIGSATSCSVWQFTTGDVSYCDADVNSQDEYLTRVQINNDIDNSSGYSSGGYCDYTNLSTSLMQGETNVPVTININTFYAGDDISIWIDWNRDGDFTDAGEYIICADLTTTSWSSTFDVPATASVGNTRMRIRLKYYDNACNGNSCGNTSYGEVEDYTINIQAAGPNLSVSPSSLDFGDVCPNTTTGSKSFTITGSLLTTDDVTIDALNGYIYSTTAGGTYSTSLTLPQAGGSYNQIIYVKFTPTAVAGYNGNIIVGGGGASNENIVVTGNGTGFSIPLTANANTVDCPNSADGTIDLSVPFPVQFNDPDYIETSSNFLSGLGAFTIEGWIKPTSNNRNSLFGQDNAIELGFASDGRVELWSEGLGTNVYSSNAFSTDGEWHHIAVVGDGSQMIIYIDGVPAGTNAHSLTTDYGSSSNNVMIGGYVFDSSDPHYFEGQILKLGFWDRALSDTEVSNMASGYHHYTDSETGLLAGYNFFEGEGTTLNSVTAGTDGSFNDTPTWLDNYTYSWTKSGDAGFSATTQDLSGVESGTYSVEVANSSVACSNTGSWTINHSDNEDPTIKCPKDVTVNPDAGLCTASGVDLDTPKTKDNCPGETISNDAPVTFPLGQTIVIWTVTDAAGNTATCQQTVTVESAEIIDIEVIDLGNSCQSGETGSTTTITWDINLEQGSNNWTYDYTINDGTTDVQTGTNVSAAGNIQISCPIDNTTAVNKTLTITIFNVKDNCGVAETETGNNSDSATLFGVPNTGDIIPD